MSKNNNEKTVQTFDVKVGGAVVPMTMEQLIANAGRGVLASRDKNYNAPYKKNAKKFEALSLSEEEYQSLLDAKSGNREAGEFFYKSLVPDEDGEKVYKPRVEEEKNEEFEFLNSVKEYSPESYGKFMDTINNIGHDIYAQIKSQPDHYAREAEAKKLYDDITNGDFNSKIGLAMFESSQSDKNILLAYNDVVLKSDNTNQQEEGLGNASTPHSPNSTPQFYTPDVGQQKDTLDVTPEGNTKQDMVSDWRQKMAAKFG